MVRESNPEAQKYNTDHEANRMMGRPCTWFIAGYLPLRCGCHPGGQARDERM